MPKSTAGDSLYYFDAADWEALEQYTECGVDAQEFHMAWDGTRWSVSYHTIGSPMGHGAEGSGATLALAIEDMIAHM